MINTLKINLRRILKIAYLIFVLSLIPSVFILAPFKSILFSQRMENQNLAAQYQKQRQMNDESEELKNKLINSQQNNSEYFKAINKISNLAYFYAQLGQIAHGYHFIVFDLKPKNSETIAQLQKQIFSLEIEGAERSIWSYLQSLFHQPVLIELIQVEIIKTGNGARLQALLAIYYRLCA